MGRRRSREPAALLIEEPPLQVLPSLAALIGLNEAIFLQQLHWRLRASKHRRDGRTWVYNTYDDWHREFPFWSVRTIRRIISNLETGAYGERPDDRANPPLVISTTEYNEHRTDHTKWYAIERRNLRALELPEPAGDVDNLATSEDRPGQSGHNDVAKVATSSMRQETTKRDTGPSGDDRGANGRERRPPLTYAQMYELDPVADREAILRGSLLPAAPLGASMNDTIVWMDLAEAWRKRHGK
jgi:hypothetical protein